MSGLFECDARTDRGRHTGINNGRITMVKEALKIEINWGVINRTVTLFKRINENGIIIGRR